MYNSVRDRLAKGDQAGSNLEHELEQQNVKMREFLKDREKNYVPLADMTVAMTEVNRWQSECERREALFAHLEESTREELEGYSETHQR